MNTPFAGAASGAFLDESYHKLQKEVSRRMSDSDIGLDHFFLSRLEKLAEQGHVRAATDLATLYSGVLTEVNGEDYYLDEVPLSLEKAKAWAMRVASKFDPISDGTYLLLFCEKAGPQHENIKRLATTIAMRILSAIPHDSAEREMAMDALEKFMRTNGLHFQNLDFSEAPDNLRVRQPSAEHEAPNSDRFGFDPH